jgi:hypothetical protein
MSILKHGDLTLSFSGLKSTWAMETKLSLPACWVVRSGRCVAAIAEIRERESRHEHFWPRIDNSINLCG